MKQLFALRVPGSARQTRGPGARRPSWPWALAVSALLSACGTGDSTDPSVPASCSVADQNTWLSGYMNATYFWTGLSPKPSPVGYSSVPGYFDALLYNGTSPSFPADRWSYTQTTESFERFYGDGQTLGYGLSVAGVEVTGLPDQPLRVRYVEPRSDAAARGVVRGDEVVSVNGRTAASIIAADDYSAFTPAAAGNTLTLVLRNTAGDLRTVTLTAGVYTLTPVSTTAVVTSPGGRKLGYLVVKDMVSQALAPIDAAFAQFKSAGVQDVVLDLRYNGGGLVSVGASLASYVPGPAAAGQVYAALLFNDKQAAAYNQTFRFASSTLAAGVSRVFVLTGPRTCSASEQLINALRGVGVTVVAVGDTTCGKPVGFLPESQCGTTFSAVNFESVNARNEGRYFDGFGPTCAVDEDFTKALGSTSEPLLATAASYADRGFCPLVEAQPLARNARIQALAQRQAGRPLGDTRGEAQGMWGR
ncbi:MAG: S41 family peptidase [Rubrivivax sp.]